MAASLRAGSSLLRTSTLSSRPAIQRAAFNGVRAASTKVSCVFHSELIVANKLPQVAQRHLRRQPPCRTRKGQEAEKRLWQQGHWRGHP